MTKLKRWLNNIIDFSYRYIEERNLLELQGVDAKINSKPDSKMDRMMDVIFRHVHVSGSDINKYEWYKSYYSLWWKFDKTYRKSNPIYDICSEEFNAEKYYNALYNYVKANESKLDNQPTI